MKIGDTLTMVISVEGDPGFDVQVQDCIAHDGDRANAVTLTDNRGCVLKKKLMGPWQKSTQTGRPGVSLVAFSFFQAFKFPDVMEVFLECNVELCKSGCDVCPEDAALVRSNSFYVKKEWNFKWFLWKTVWCERISVEEQAISSLPRSEEREWDERRQWRPPPSLFPCHFQRRHWFQTWLTFYSDSHHWWVDSILNHVYSRHLKKQ